MEFKLYNIFNEIIFEERKLLSESVSDGQINDAINKRYRVKITYQGEKESQPSQRFIDVYAYGTSKAGNKVIRVYQSFGKGGYSWRGSKTPGWKFLRTDRILSWTPTNYFLYKDKAISDIDKTIEPFNILGDNSMTTVYNIVKLQNKRQIQQ